MEMKVVRDPNFMRAKKMEPVKEEKKASELEREPEAEEEPEKPGDRKKLQYFRHLYFNPEYGAGYLGIKKIWVRYKYEKEKYKDVPTITYIRR
jgi:hypothetical protein